MEHRRPALVIVLSLALVFVLGNVVLSVIVISLWAFSGPGRAAPTLVEAKTIAQPDEVSSVYVVSGNIESYVQDQGWGDVAVLEATSPAMLEKLVEHTLDLAETQGFEQTEKKRGSQVFARTWDPLLQQATSEYLEIAVVGQKLIIARGTNLDLVHQLVREARKDAQ